MSFQLHKDREHPPVSRRAVLLGALGLAGMGVVGSRLYYLQFIRSQKFQTLAEDNRIKLQIIPPSRGLILDREGKALAENESVFRVFLELDKNPAPMESVRKLQQWVDISEYRIEKIKKMLRQRYPVILVKDRVPWEEVVKIEHHIPQLPGIEIEQGQQRVYPLAEQAAHAIGYVGAVSEEQKESFYRWPEAKSGKQGLERSLEERLRGEPGLRQLEVNVHGLPLRKINERPSVAGEDLTTSLHRELQAFTYNRLLTEKSGSAVIMNAQTGEVLAIASAPSFNSTVMSQGIGREAWEELRQSNRYPLLDKTIAGQYPPGSVFKMMTGLAGLHNSVINPYRRIHCPGHFYMGRKRFNCWKAGGHGSMNLRDALAQSCDTFFYTVANEMGMEPLAEMCKRFGLGERSGVDIPGEKGGVIPSPDWKRRSYDQPWHPGDTINASIGQGYVLTTPIQLARMTAALVNGGNLLRPRLLQEELSEKLKINPTHLEAIRRGMEAVVNGPRGTAMGSRIWDQEFLMGGKTGTAQVKRIEVRGQDQSKVPWHFRHHALFVGYAPMENPRYVCSVVIEHGGGGSSTAAPIAKELILKTRELVG